jgi:long-subunit acyl-CoA synthetase (AMP-forming)
MYTSGTTGDPKGVLISNKSIVTIVSAVDEFLNNSNEQVDHSYFASVFSIPTFYKILFCSISFTGMMFTFPIFRLLISLTG